MSAGAHIEREDPAAARGTTTPSAYQGVPGSSRGEMRPGALPAGRPRPSRARLPLDWTPLRTIRVGMRLGQAELAERAGVAECTVRRIETRRQAPSFDTVLRLAKALGVHWQMLYAVAPTAPTRR